MARARLTRAIGITTAVAVAVTVSVAVSAPSHADPSPTVDTIVFAKPSVTASGVSAAVQVVSAHITTPQGAWWRFHLTGTGGSGTLRALDAWPRVTSGTFTDGTWTATVQVPSTADGTWALTSMAACTSTGCLAPVAVGGSPTFTVVGHHQPRLTFGAVPTVVAYPNRRGVVKGRVVDAETHRGMPGLLVGYGDLATCTPDPAYETHQPFSYVGITNAAGYYTLSADDLSRTSCVGLLATLPRNVDPNAVFPVLRSFTVPIKPWVTATAAAGRAAVGSQVSVTGQVFDWGLWDGHGRTVLVQVLHGRTQWRTVATVDVRLNARWNAVVSPARGANVYRAVTPASAATTASTSARFTVVGG
jgi:hypothetical protein